MNPLHLMTEACTITNRSTEPNPSDPYGNDEIVETTTSSVCYRHQRDGGEDTVQADWQIQHEGIWLPATVVLDGSSMVTVAGDVYELIGPPKRAYNPRTRQVSHYECTGRRVT